ncbi:glycine-rich cell wall structural protein 1.8-like isoform X1 [Oryza brachyantha]|uniref:Uncharacterized protein n=1 Tax=Oryza brachyantha TaxID=4533 RepID=J3LMV1_ORYBR|nr:glycine-rich cell wall structural protein 1.8-like isoform X1 [Oryza brachyantha]
MEDSVGEEERREQEEAMAQGKERGGEDDAGGESGFLSTVASKIGAAMSGGAEEDGEGNGDGNVAAASGGGEEQRKRDGDGGGGGIFGKILPTESMAQGKEHGNGEVDGGGVEPGDGSGFLTTVASKIGAAMSGSNGSGDAEKDDGGGEHNGDGNVPAAPGGEEEGKRDDNGGGGIFVETEEERNEVDEQGQQAGILGAVASKIGVAMSGANGHAKHGVGNEDDARMSNGDAADHSTAEEKGDGQNGGGIMKQLISNLPTDDQAPDAEEASLLIAIIDD